MAANEPTYISRMEHFLVHDYDNLASSERTLFLKLFHLNNKAMWAEWFEARNVTLSALTGLTENNLIRAKKRLKEKGLIDFQAGKRGKPSRYRLTKPGESANYTVNFESVTESVTERETASRSQAPQGAAGSLRLKTKDIKRPKSKRGVEKSSRFSPPTLYEVQIYVQQNGLPVDPQKFFDFYEAGGWKDSRGRQVRNWKQKIRTWANYEKGAKKDGTKVDKDFWSRFDDTGGA